MPYDLLNGRTSAEARERSKRIVVKNGKLLHAWPEIVEAAKDLRARGHSLAKEI